MNSSTQQFEDFLTDVRMRAANDLTDYICGLYRADDPDRPDPADVHEDVREDLWKFFEEIRLRVDGPKCSKLIPVGLNVSYACRLLADHEGECARV